MSDGSGRKCSEFAKLSDHDGLWLRTFEGSFPRVMDDYSEPFSGTWPMSGIVLNGRSFRRVRWDLHTHEKDCSLWPTPTATDWKGASDGQKKMGKSASYLRQATHAIAQLEDADGGKSSYPHPSFAEALMGFPVGWTVLDASETPSSPK
jgi:hypothetical protein